MSNVRRPRLRTLLKGLAPVIAGIAFLGRRSGRRHSGDTDQGAA